MRFVVSFFSRNFAAHYPNLKKGRRMNSTLTANSNMGKQKTTSATPNADKKAKPLANETASNKGRFQRPLSQKWVYGLGFLLLWVFCSWTYGDVFRHIASENFFAFDREAMRFLERKDFGLLFWVGRFFLLVFKNQWVGGALMAAVLTLAARSFDAAWRRSAQWMTAGFLPILAMLGFCVFRGYNLYLRNEPSTFVLLTLGLLIVAALYALVVAIAQRGKATAVKGGFPVMLIVSLLAYGGLTYYALVPQNYVRMTTRMQNCLEAEDWEGMIEAARSVERPTRSMAALHALALTRTDRLLSEAWEIEYDFPEVKLDYIGGTDEGPNYMPDCNLHAGLVNSAYRATMENTVVIGPRVDNYKRMALCSMLNGEKALAERYFRLIAKMPFEGDFVERYRPMLNDTALIASDPTLAHIRTLAPMERNFEQNYRQPIFLGYNFSLNQGTDATLVTSVATCMYSKDLDNFLMRARVLRTKMTLPLPVLQAIGIASLKREGLLQHFPEVTPMVMNQIEAFVTEVAPYFQAQQSMNEEQKAASRLEAAEKLRKDWLGTYMYYYYCGNMAQQQDQAEGAGVN